jgi:GNAT superfamily N-acetyltransferase
MAEKLIVTCRPARQSDTQGVIELTQNIWEGHDYVPQVWEEWLADEHGLLAVAEHEDRLVGLGKLTRVSDADWWLEGLRTHPGLEGRGVASQMHAYLLERWLQTGAGTLRLATASFRVAVHRLCQRTGFDKVAELTFFKAPATQADVDSTEVLGKTFRLLKPGEAGQALAFASQSPLLAYTSGMEMGTPAQGSLRRCYRRGPRLLVACGPGADHHHRRHRRRGHQTAFFAARRRLAPRAGGVP